MFFSVLTVVEFYTAAYEILYILYPKMHPQRIFWYATLQGGSEKTHSLSYFLISVKLKKNFLELISMQHVYQEHQSS